MPSQIEGKAMTIMSAIINDKIIVVNGRFIEGAKVFVSIAENDKIKRIERTAKYDSKAGDLYIQFDGRKYFYSEFEIED